MTLAKFCFLAAALCFGLEFLDVRLEDVEFVPLGLALFAAGHLA